MSTEQRLEYENYISLGYFCGVAQDLEKMGLRKTSSPFDWCITDMRGVMQLINSKFESFMNYENMAQNVEMRNHYLDTKYGIFFFHDFSKYKSLAEQIDKVKEKYLRRIGRFLRDIEKDTLFVRYISDEQLDGDGKSIELQWIEEHHEYILEVLQAYNTNNRILYIGNEGMQSDILKIYNVKIDENDRVSRSPIYCNEELYLLFKEATISNRDQNIMRYKQKYKQNNSILKRIWIKILSKYNYYFKDVYIHSKEYK